MSGGRGALGGRGASGGRGALGEAAGPARCHVEDGLAIGVSTAHDAEITEDTVVPTWYGERLDLDYAIAVCFANARTEQEKRADREQAQEDVFRPKSWGDGNLSTTAEYIRR